MLNKPALVRNFVIPALRMPAKAGAQDKLRLSAQAGIHKFERFR